MDVPVPVPEVQPRNIKMPRDFHAHINDLKLWQPNRSIKELIKDTCFCKFGEMGSRFSHEGHLISFLINAYDVKHGFFEIGTHRFVITLEDILFITGLPVDGEPVTGVQITPADVGRYLGTDFIVNKSNISFTSLRDKFSNKEDICAARAYILYVIGTIFITGKNYNVDIKFLPLLEDLNKINSYAWGAAVLANLHKFLKDFKTTNSTTFGGAAYILMFFILERIPKLQSIILRSKPFQLPSSVPLMCQWIQNFSAVAKSTNSVPTIRKYEEELLNLLETDIIWQPYNRLNLNELPLYVREQRHLGRCMTVVVCFNEAGNHRPDYAPMQFGLEDVHNRESPKPIEKRRNQLLSGRHWADIPVFKSYITSWDKRLENMIGQMPNEAIPMDIEREPTPPNEVGSMDQHADFERDQCANFFSHGTNASADSLVKMPNLLQQHSGESASCKKKLLVLDINGILADIVETKIVPGSMKNNSNIQKFNSGSKTVFLRPHYDDFLKFCFERFDVGVWSSRLERNLTPVVDEIFKSLKAKLLFIWDQSHCTRTQYLVRGTTKPVFLKELKKLWDTSENGKYNETNSLLLDDSPYKALRNPEYTSIFPQTFTFEYYYKDTSLDSDGDLRQYLQNLDDAENVQTYVRENPYGKNAITQSHPDWIYYHQICG